MVERPRSLYQCFNAKVKGEEIYCAKGYRLGTNKTGTINIQRLVRGGPLNLKVCQLCKDYEEMGEPIPKDERGWREFIKASV